jgi:hypothetical protein
MDLEIIGYARHCVTRVVPEIGKSVAVEIHGVTAIAAWDKLRQPHRSGIGPLDSAWIKVLFAAEQQQVLELTAEK